MSTVLAKICADKRQHVATRKRACSFAQVMEEAAAAAPPRGFMDSLETALAATGTGLIAEIKKASPSQGAIRDDFDAAALAQAYENGGAACLSVLTDGPYFQGADDDLIQARAAVHLPVLRKDFMVDPYQIAESRALGADCVLLILAALSDGQAGELEDAARGFGMDVLAEIHDEAELERAAGLDAWLIGINNRDLKTLSVDIATTEKLAGRVPPGSLIVSESGIGTLADIERLRRAGASCFLVGSSLMRSGDVEAATRALLDAAPAAASR
jgi:indole-3-glycerol phosphate synthase